MAHPSLTDLTYGDLVVEALSRFPDRDAFVRDDRRMTYAHAADLLSRIQQVLAGHGIGRGAAVGALSPNEPETWLVQAASYLLGAHYTGLHPLASVEDHVTVCDDAGITVLVVHRDHAAAGAAIAARSSTVRHVLSMGDDDLGPDLLTLADRYPSRPLRRGPATEDDISWLTYTGGTTGAPKGVAVPHRAMAALCEALPVGWSMPRSARYLVGSPITHAGGLPILPVLLGGGTVVLQHGFDPGRWLHAVESEHISFAFVVPTMLYKLLDHATRPSGTTASLETVVYGAAPMSPTRIAETQELLGPVLVQAYGQTESLAMGTSLRADEHDPRHRPDLLTSCGRPVPGTRVTVLDEEDQPVPDGTVGQLCLRSRAVMNAYWGRPDLTTETLSSGWLHTGDLGYRDDHGYFHLVDRTKDLIITGGFNVYPKEIEDVIAARPEISGVAVIGVPDDRWGEAVTAVVTVRPGAELDQAALIADVRARKGSHQAPKTVERVAELPTTVVGKIDKKALRRRYWAEGERGVH
ncbi:AMP-binding protein [Actinomycetospora chiangmaiensis]|uniref:AMP-binding protein n=1 Tax=Actinomycetospora chiangmaiensis TaxID=402650 RepID=UPI0003628D19|nr:AMP-binding protein [Actinomycetospora chiangmaiensis]